MKILYLLSNPGLGGTETLLLETLPHINKKGCVTQIVNLWRGSDMGKISLADSVEYKEFSTGGSLASPFTWLRILKIIRDGNFDIVHTFGLRLSLVLRLLRPMINRPLVISIHSINLWYSWYHSLADSLTQNFCDIFVPISNAVKESHVKKCGLKAGKMVVIPNGTDLNEFNPEEFRSISRQELGLPEDKTVVTTIANIRYAKGHDFYIDVIDRYFRDDDSVLFVWIGRGDLRENIQSEINELKLQNRIKMIERVDDIRPVLARSDCFVLSSREEGMPRALMEAMAMGLPCVATNVGGVGEVIEDSVSGLICEFGNVEQFGAHIRTILDNQDRRKKLGEIARQRIQDKFDILKVAGYYVTLYRELLDGNRNGPQIEQSFAVSKLT